MNFSSKGDQCCANFTPDSPHFFKIILDDTDTQKLRIPKKFVKSYGSEISSSVSLKVPSGEFWKVELSKCADGTWLQNGWSEFAKHYSLSHGSFLVFRYEGNCNFHVIIFDKSATEISYPYSGNHDSRVPNCERFNNHETDHNTDDIPVEIIDDIPPSEKTRKRSSPSNQPHRKIDSTSIDNKSVDILDGISPSKKRRARSQSPSSRPCKKINSTLTTSVKDSAIKSSRVKYERVSNAKRSGDKRPERIEVCRRKGRLRKMERANALHLASPFSSKNPFFKVVMQPSYIYGVRLRIPPAFYEKYLFNCSGDVILNDCHGKSSSLKISLDPRPRLCSGWKKFANENDLEVGDVCVFELINQTTITFNVVIRRAQDAETRPIPEKDGGKCAPQKLISFESENPFFKITTKPSLIYTRVNVPYTFIKKHIKKDGVNLAIENRDKMWPVKVSLYEYPPRNGVAFLGEGWGTFARENSVKAGDVYAFELISKKDAKLRVHLLNKSANDLKRASSPSRPRKKNSTSRDNISVLDDTAPSKKTRVRSPTTISQPRVKDSAIKFPVPDPKVDSVNRRGKHPPRVEVSTRKITLRPGERANILQRTRFISKNPFFKVPMQPSYVYGKKMRVASKFASKHLLNCSGDAILSTCHGKTWSVTFSFEPWPKFCRGWKKFATENNLEVGDVCIFELINQTKITFNVVIRRAQDAITRPTIPAKDGGKCAPPSAI